MKKSTLYALGIYAALFYVVGAFGVWELNPGDWHPIVRFCVCTSVGIFTFLSTVKP